MRGSASTTKLSNNALYTNNKKFDPFLRLTNVTEDMHLDFNKFKKLIEYLINIIAGHEQLFKITED